MFNAELLIAVENYFNKHQVIKFEGKKESKDSLLSLQDRLKSILPIWYQEFLLNYPINGLILDLNIGTDDKRSIEFVGFEGIQEEFYDLYPGCAIGELGYLCIGEDPTGGGDPYFINIHEGHNPPVYQVYHDAGEVGKEIIENGKEKIANQLSDLFKIAGIN